MCRQILGQPTQRQSQVALSASTVDIDNDQTDEQPKEFTKPSYETETRRTNYGDQLFVHYTHEKRFQTFKRDMHQVL
jgi:hypothetical protein